MFKYMTQKFVLAQYYLHRTWPSPLQRLTEVLSTGLQMSNSSALCSPEPLPAPTLIGPSCSQSVPANNPNTLNLLTPVAHYLLILTQNTLQPLNLGQSATPTLSSNLKQLDYEKNLALLLKQVVNSTGQ